MPFVMRVFHHDHLGSTRMITDLSGNIESVQETLAYGDDLTEPLQTEEGTILNNIGFTGHEHDYGTGFINMQARLQDPKEGKFNVPDPGHDYDQMDPMSFNLYSYVRCNPIGRTDPTGMKTDDDSPRSLLAQLEREEFISNTQKKRNARKERVAFNHNKGQGGLGGSIGTIKETNIASNNSNNNVNQSATKQQDKLKKCSSCDEPTIYPNYYVLIIISGTAAIGKYGAGEGGVMILYNEYLDNADILIYLGGGFGFGKGGGGSIELVPVYLNHREDIRGFGIAVSAFATPFAPLGGTTQIAGALNPFDLDHHYAYISVPSVSLIGSGGGISGIFTYTYYLKTVNFNQLPKKIQSTLK